MKMNDTIVNVGKLASKIKNNRLL